MVTEHDRASITIGIVTRWRTAWNTFLGWSRVPRWWSACKLLLVAWLLPLSAISAFNATSQLDSVLFGFGALGFLLVAVHAAANLLVRREDGPAHESAATP